MSIHYILGGPGSGKTTKLMKELIESAIRNPDVRHIMLVPEQYTMQTQRDIVRLHPEHAAMNIDILSFERLAYRVLGETGKEDMGILSNMGKNMLLRRIAEEHKKELSVFRRSLKRPGFISRLMTILSEFYQYGVDEDMLIKVQSEVKNPLLQRKLKDLQIFFNALNQSKGEDTMAAEELLSLLLHQMNRSVFLDHTVIAMDYFTGFTPVQYRIIKKMMERADRISIALCVPEAEWRRESREEDLFHMSQAVVYTCNDLAKECAIKTSMEFLPGDLRHKENPELAYLTEHLMQYHKAFYEGQVEKIKAVSLRNPREEAEYAASLVRRMVMDEGLRYRDIAIVTGDIEGYRPYLETAFARYRIPAFMDRKKGIMGNPLVEFLRSGMAVITQDFSYDAVFRFLKCGIPMVDPDDLNLFDNYCLKHHVHGRKRYETEWEPSRAEDSERYEILNTVRARILFVLAPLMDTRNVFSSQEEGHHRITVKERTDVLRLLMEANETEERMNEMSEELFSLDRVELSEEYRLVQSFVEHLLDEMDVLLGDQPLSLQEFSDVFEAGLAEAKLGMIPATLDRLQVGDVMRSRLTEIKVLIVIGFNEGVIPGGAVSGGILTEQERSILADMEIELAPTAEHVMNQERFYLYRLFTRPSDRIVITHSRMGMDGSAKRISYLWSHLKNLFGELEIKDGDALLEEFRLDSEDQAWMLFAKNLQKLKKDTDETLLSLGRSLMEEDRSLILSMVENAFVRDLTDSLTAAASEELYGKDLNGDVSRLEQYAACAYAHFLAYGLQLAERNTGDFTRANRGSYFHRTLELFFRTCKEKGIDARELDPEERRKLVEKASLEAASDKGLNEMEDTGTNAYKKKRWADLADRTVWAICTMLEQEEFIPSEFEFRFDGSRLKALTIDLDEEHRMILKGVVDRLDVLEAEESRYLRVIDYKTSNVKLDLSQIYLGHQLQLPMYLNAVMEKEQRKNSEKENVPGGVYYYHLNDPIVKCSAGADNAVVEGELLKELRLSGLTLDSLKEESLITEVSGDKIDRRQFELLCSHARKKAAEFGREILEGRIRAVPFRYKKETGCDYCKYSGICGFNSRRAGSSYRVEKAIEKKELWKLLEEENSGSEMDG